VVKVVGNLENDFLGPKFLLGVADVGFAGNPAEGGMYGLPGS
jgi:hypothetical protein